MDAVDLACDDLRRDCFTVWARVVLGRFALLGSALARYSTRALLGFVLVTASFIIKIGQEERLLASHFGPAFADYRGRARRLIPFVW